MNNFESGERLVNQAERIYQEVLLAYKERDFNRTVRRAQEVVELSLKGILKMMAIEYPKVHDVGIIFQEAVKKEGVKIKEKEFEKIVEISAELARKRAPAFYWEEAFSLKDAQQSKNYASFVLRIILKLAKEVKKQPRT